MLGSEYLSGNLDDLMDAPIEEAIIPEEAVINESIMEHIQNPALIQEMVEEIERVDHYAWSRGSMGLDFGYESLNRAFRGLNPGLHLVAGQANSGKSMLLLNILWQVSKKNQFQNEEHPKKAFCLYFSLDDTNNELMPRIVAMEEQIRINQVLFPKSLESPTVIQKRQNGIDKLKENVHFFAMKDADDGVTMEYIQDTVDDYLEMLEQMDPEGYQLAIFIDNFHDVQIAEPGFSEDNARFDKIADGLSHIANTRSVPVMCSAEFRKIDTVKRPTLADIKSTSKINYESKGTILLHNDVGVKGDDADVYWELADDRNPEVTQKMPVLEMNIAKNKMSEHKGHEFLRFIPNMATFVEVGEDEANVYRQMMKY